MDHRPAQIDSLTSLRFFAAALVFLEHVQMLPGLTWIGVPNGVPGKIGVSLFFVLSGFILAYSYGHRNWEGHFGKETRGYFFARFARIYPLFWLMYFIALPLGLASNNARIAAADQPWLFTLTDKLSPWHHPGWGPIKSAGTLSCELIFYLCVPFLLLGFGRSKHRALASALLVFGATLLFVSLDRFFPHLNWSGYLRLPEFFLGMAGYYWYQKFPTPAAANPLLAGGLLLTAAAAALDLSATWPYFYYFYAPGSLLIILGTLHSTTRTGRFLSHPLLLLLGHSSYALYLLHETLLRYLKVAMDRKGMVLSPVIGVAVALVLLGGMAWLSILCFRLYENPVRLKLRAWFSRKPGNESAAPPSPSEDSAPILPDQRG